MTPVEEEQQVAVQSAQALWERDAASRHLGITLQEVGPGYARTELTISESMVNGLATAHGGVLFTLADTTFALACNSRNVPHVAIQCSISYINAARLGDVIVAEAVECSLKGRTGVYDVTLRREDALVALMRGVCYRVTGTVI